METFSGENVHGSLLRVSIEMIPHIWILLDSQSITNIFSNGLLQKIIEGGVCMNICGKSGVSYTNLVGDLKGFPELIWYDPKGITNILSLLLVEKKISITYGNEN